MMKESARWAISMILTLGLGMVFTTPVRAANAVPAKAEIKDGIYIRIICFGHAFEQVWTADGHDAQSIIKMVEELKPDVLNRFMNGKQNLNLKVPVAKGSPEMTELEFLKAVMKAGAPGCTISPKVHLNDKWPEDYRIQAAQSLRDIPLNPRLTMVDLDCWFTKVKDTERNTGILKKLRAMGWTQMVTNPGPMMKRVSLYGYESSVMAYMMQPKEWKTTVWKVPKQQIEFLHKKGIKRPLLHIDYPNQNRLFAKIAPDLQADIIKDCASQQRTLGYRFVYPVLIGMYDSTKAVTSKNGPYKGVTVFQFIKQMIEKDRQSRK